ncbi:hypothetical protein F5J12DRAFT_785132 [Pisolithus orientalis]|uniref:uncharacterized protein n=1 Tax=Pisolithus orientalis TaxID=936130 RepID=UPI0022259186|nr:uncharacterized protein F5J12DRAFT_785132 [Pisolithus orientalis]KAI5997668.1 hypothetical protein F5J12DRAFT_785132 [Pisolithus orientalis]
MCWANLVIVLPQSILVLLKTLIPSHGVVDDEGTGTSNQLSRPRGLGDVRKASVAREGITIRLRLSLLTVSLLPAVDITLVHIIPQYLLSGWGWSLSHHNYVPAVINFIMITHRGVQGDLMFASKVADQEKVGTLSLDVFHFACGGHEVWSGMSRWGTGPE